jgi:hypothetical protein
MNLTCKEYQNMLLIEHLDDIIIQRCIKCNIPNENNGSINHIAWKATGAAAFRQHLKSNAIEFKEQNLKDAGYQVFLYDSASTKLEFNFLNEHVLNAVPVGTTA